MKVGLTIFFLVLSGYYLYPTFQGYFMDRTANNLPEEERIEWERENAAKIRTVNEKALKLGLDLQGGMHVTLEVRVDALIDALATDQDEVFDAVLQEARDEAFQTGGSVIDAFVANFEARDPNMRLSRYFRNEPAGITRRSTNAEVAAWLSTEADAAVARAIEIIRDRVDRYGVTEPAIQRQGSRRVIVELPGIDDEERIRGLLRGTARLDFRLMAEPDELLRSLQRIIEYYEVEPDSADVAAADTSMDVLDLLDSGEDGTSGNLLLDKFQPIGQGVIFGSSVAADTAAVNAMLDAPEVQAMLPSGVTLMYTSSPEGMTADGEEVYYIVGVLNEADLTGEVVTDARVEFDPFTNVPEVSMDMNSEGARTWARMTGANVGKQVAIVLDGVVYSFPTIQQRITGGRTNITNLASREEAADIVTVLKSGALPAPVDIVEERTVGPSLGERSIRAGLNSVILGLVLVALFMIFYYRGGGMIANLALILNLIFIMGILAGFNATLTLPGIAGIVLTIGMAVDANVLIFERIREEQSTGKTFKASVEGGYAKALSAIFDANITTFFVGVILYSFGLGPIQGFAVTLMAGILSSLFTAIVFTRIIFDYLIAERRLTVSVG
jgi:preprotein translocase subunit SecD